MTGIRGYTRLNTATVDAERGTMMTIRLGTQKVLLGLPRNMRTTIIEEFLKWTAGGPDQKLEDAGANGILEILKGQQRNSVNAWIRASMSRREWRSVAGQAVTGG